VGDDALDEPGSFEAECAAVLREPPHSGRCSSWSATATFWPATLMRAAA
jgi:hypothetical protein